MRKTFAIALMTVVVSAAIPVETEAARVRVRRTGPRTARVIVRPGFPIRRTLPNVVVRPAPVVRVAPRVYLGPVAFAAVAVATLPAGDQRVWMQDEVLEREDGWTDFTMNVDRRGTAMLLRIERGAAQVNFAEVVFENGEAQVVDFNESTHAPGLYSLLDFRDGRKVDHVRVIAKAATKESEVRLVLVR